MKNHKNIGFLSNTGPDPIKITKLTSQDSMLGHYRHASETLAGRLWLAYSVFYPLSPNQLKKEEKDIVRLGPPLTKLTGSASVREKCFSSDNYSQLQKKPISHVLGQLW